LTITQWAGIQDEREMEAHEEKMAQRKRIEDQRGNKIDGSNLGAPEPGVRESDQVNLTDEESRIMPFLDGGVEQTYNCQACLDIESGLLLTHGESDSRWTRGNLPLRWKP